jgi:hypothetical protein
MELSMGRPFSMLFQVPCEQRARFYFVAWLIYKLLVHSVTNDYQLEADWNLKWKIAPFEGKVILTPANKPVE